MFALSIVADDAKGPAKWRWTILGAIVAISVVAVAAYENHRAESARQKTHRMAVKAARELALAYNQVLVPTTQELRDLAASYAASTQQSTSTQLVAHRAAILKGVLASAVALTAEPTAANLPRARSAYYERDPSTGDYNLKDTYGRLPQPRPKIAATDVAGAHLNGILTSGNAFWADGNPGRVSYLDHAGTRYRAVIAAPVRANGRLFGVLTVDAPEYHDFVPAHVDLMSTLANLLAASQALGGP